MPRFLSRRGIAVLAACLICGATAIAPSASATDDLPPSRGTVPTAGATIVGERWLTQRTLQLTVATDAFAAPVPVEVMFPTGYGASTPRSWPVTYNLAGTNSDQTAFRTAVDGEVLTASYPSIVVSPRGDSGYWSDWFNNGASEPPEYETFVTRQLVPLIDANFRTVPDRAHRMVMGESMGGYGAVMLGARHPDAFAAVASLSGAPDSNWPAGAAAISISPTLQGAAPDSVYGPFATEAVRWHGHNPTDLAENLTGVDVQVFTGNGVLDTAREETAADVGGCVLESGIVRPESVSLHNTLLSLGIPHGWQDLPWGCHSPALFEYEIAQAIQRFETLLATPPVPPAAFDYRSIEPAFSVWGWSVNADPNRALEFLDLHDVSASGLTVTGSGTTTITTPPLFSGVAAVTVAVDGVPAAIRPDKSGRITFTVNLGPADQQQQYAIGSVTNLRTSVVTFG